MSPDYLKGIRRILTVSADTELVSAPAYLRAAEHAPALNNFGSAISIIQDELAHAHIGYRLLGDLGVDMTALIYEREPTAFKYPYAFDVPLDSWDELVLANALYDQAGLRAAFRRPPAHHLRPLEARAGQGRQGGDLPPAPRPHVGQEALPPTRTRSAQLQAVAGLDVHPHARVVRPAGRAQAATASSSSTASRARPTTSCARTGWASSCRSWTRSASTCRRTSTSEQRWVIDCPFPGRFDAEAQARGCSTTGRSRGTT